jgi:hypothetical protein
MATFPNEILRLIFECVYLLAYGDNPDDDEDLTWSPYFIFVVCKQWRAVAQSLPLYARRVMIYIDEPFSIPELENQIALSKPMRMKFFVVRKNYDSRESPPLLIFDSLEDEELNQRRMEASSPVPPTDPLEKSRIEELIILLTHHILRCQVLVFDLLLRSSLPCLSHFCGYAARLRTLRLKSRVVDSMNHDPPLRTADLRTFICSGLRYLDLDGAIFARAAQIPGWLDSMQSLPGKSLTISNLFSGDCGAFDLYDLLCAVSMEKMGHLTSLKLCNIHLNTMRCHQLESVLIFVQNLEFVDLPRSVLAGFFAAQSNYIEVNFIKIRDCDLTSTDPFVSWELALFDIDETEDITNFVRNWDGFSLRFENCLTVNDTLLKMMMEWETNDAYYVPSCRQISISPFENISAQALKDLLVAREQLAERPMSLHCIAPKYYPMFAVCLTGTGPPLSPSDKEWFNKRLNSFVWYTPNAGFESPKIEDDLADWVTLPEVRVSLSCCVLLF